MKAEILKIAKCKTEKQFYSKYPSEEAFMKAHGKEFKKAQMGVAMSKPATPSYSDLLNQTQLNVTGTNNKIQQEQAYKQQMLTAQQQPKQSGGFDFGKAIGQIGDIAGKIGASKMGKSYNGKRIPKALEGFNQSYMPNSTGGYGSTAPDPAMQGINYKFGQSSGMPQQLGYQGISGNQMNLQGQQSSAPSIQSSVSGMPNAQVGSSKGSDILGGLQKGLGKFSGPAGELIGGFQALAAEKEALKGAKQTLAVGNLSREAQDSGFQASARDAASMRSKQFLRPEEQVFTGENLFPVGGVGTNPLAKDGISLDNRIGGNPGEIQNTFAPNDIYTDSGYEPLSDSEIVKQYREGGYIPSAAGGAGLSNWQNSMSGGGSGFSGAGAGGGTPWGMISDKATGVGQELMGGQNAGGQIGKTAGNAIGSIFGPVGGAIGGFVGGMAGNLLDTNAKNIKKTNAASDLNMNQMAMGRGMQGFAGQNSGFMEDGGWMNPEYNPQVITKFGEHNMSDLLAPDKSMDTLRAGGHLQSYTPPSERTMETYKDGGDVSTSALDGEIQTTWGGGVKTLSRNRYMPGTGETVQFVGNSHETHDGNGHTGIGVKYGQGNQDSYTNYAEYGTEQADASVEVEKEPAAELIDPKTGKKILTIWGNLPIPKYGADMIGDPDAKGKFKGYVANLSDKETKANKTISKATNKLLEFTPKTAFDKLKFSALQASIDGSNMQLKEIAEWKENAANLQNAINEHAEENGWVADDLAKGKIKIDSNPNNAKFGGKFTTAQDGTNERASWDIPNRVSDWAGEQLGNAYENYMPQFAKNVIEPPLQFINDFNEWSHGPKTSSEISREELGLPGYMGGVAPIPAKVAKAAVTSRVGKGASKAGDKAHELAMAEASKTKKVTGKAVEKAEEAKKVATTKLLQEAKALETAEYNKISDISWKRGLGIAGAASIIPLGGALLHNTFGYNPLPQNIDSNYTTPTIPTAQDSTLIKSQKKKDGDMIYKAKDGYTPSTDGKVGRENYDYLVGLYNEAKKQGKGPAVEKFQREFSRLAPQKAQSVLSQFPVTNYGKAKGITTPSLESNYDQIFGDRTKAYRHSLEAPPAETLLQPRGTGLLPIPAPPSNALMPMTPREIPTTEKEQSPWLTAFNSIVPYFRPTDKIARPDLSSEMMAMGMNQLEPVQAQLYHPQLDVPYDVSFQDQLNEINAQTRGAQRMAGYDPATQAAIAAQAYGPQSRVLADQFRANQAMKDKVYSGNRATLNDAQLKNLAILDQQATKQAQAKSNTKEQALEIAKSISDKTNKHKMEQTLANLEGQRYNYRFDPRTGRPINVNAPYEFDMSGVNAPKNRGTGQLEEGYEDFYNLSGRRVGTRKAAKDSPVTKNGGRIKALNGTIVKGLKNL
jgi:hypothetical protein